MPLIKPKLGKNRPLARMRSREHLSTNMTRELQRRHPDTPRRTMDQHRLTRPERRHINQRVIRRQEHHRNRGGINE